MKKIIIIVIILSLLTVALIYMQKNALYDEQVSYVYQHIDYVGYTADVTLDEYTLHDVEKDNINTDEAISIFYSDDDFIYKSILFYTDEEYENTFVYVDEYGIQIAKLWGYSYTVTSGDQYEEYKQCRNDFTMGESNLSHVDQCISDTSQLGTHSGSGYEVYEINFASKIGELIEYESNGMNIVEFYEVYTEKGFIPVNDLINSGKPNKEEILQLFDSSIYEEYFLRSIEEIIKYYTRDVEYSYYKITESELYVSTFFDFAIDNYYFNGYKVFTILLDEVSNNTYYINFQEKNKKDRDTTNEDMSIAEFMSLFDSLGYTQLLD